MQSVQRRLNYKQHRIFFFFTAHNVHFYHSFVNMCTLSSQDRWGKAKSECKRRTWAPFVSRFWRESCFHCCCRRAYEGEAVKETGSLACLYCGRAQREATVSLGVGAHVIHTSTPPLYASPRPVRGSTYPMRDLWSCPVIPVLLHTEILRFAVMLHDFLKHFPFPSCSFKVFLKSSSWSSGSPLTPHQRFNHIMSAHS